MSICNHILKPGQVKPYEKIDIYILYSKKQENFQKEINSIRSKINGKIEVEIKLSDDNSGCSALKEYSKDNFEDDFEDDFEKFVKVFNSLIKK